MILVTVASVRHRRGAPSPGGTARGRRASKLLDHEWHRI